MWGNVSTVDAVIVGIERALLECKLRPEDNVKIQEAWSLPTTIESLERG